MSRPFFLLRPSPADAGALAARRLSRAVMVACAALLAASCGNEAARAGQAPVLTVAPTALDFGPVRSGSHRTLPLTLKNDGQRSLNLFSVKLDNDARQAFQLGTVPKSLGGGESAIVEVTYDAGSEGADGATLAIASDSQWNSDFVVALAGRALAPCAEGEKDCSGTCTGVRDDPANCGDCARACGEGDVCLAGTCAAPSCADGVKDGPETDVDCGGSCPGCTTGGGCASGTDCASGVCSEGRCAEPTCTDHVRNGNETGVDCGGRCDPCADGGGCGGDADCSSGLCVAGSCTARPTISIADASADEGGEVVFEVHASAAVGAALSFRYATSDGTAAAGTDYEALSGSGTLAPGETMTTLRVATVPRTAYQGDRAFTMTIADPVHAVLGTASASGTIRETSAVPPATLAYEPDALTCTRGTPCSLGPPTHGGGAAATFEIAPSLPAGLSIAPDTGVISGTPTVVSAAASFTVIARNSGGSASTTVTVTVRDVAPASLVYQPDVLVCTRGTACALPAPSHGGGAVLSYRVDPVLPAGLSLDPSTGAVSGTPTDIAAAGSYTVTATNSGGSASASITVTVNDVAPANLAYSPATLVCTRGVPCALPAPTSSGGGGLSFRISPALPAGLGLDSATGVVSGTATVLSAAQVYLVTATNSGGSATASISVTVNDAAPANLAYAPSSLLCTRGVACSLGPPTSSGGAVVSYEISPALPGGLALDAGTGTISGTPGAASAQASYTVTARNSGGSASATVTITVLEPVPSGLAYAPSALVCIRGTACSLAAPTSSGGAITSYAIQPALPAGLALNPSTGAISGTPTVVSALASYTVTGTNAAGNTTAGITVRVDEKAPAGLQYSPQTLVCTKGSACSLGPPTSTGGVISAYAISPALPAGLAIAPATGVISGTPTVLSAATSYTVTASNATGSTTATVSIAVTTPPFASGTFTPAGATGVNGPGQAQVDTAYAGTPLAGAVTVNTGVQRWVVPTTGTYRIEASGGAGGPGYVSGYTGGKGARMRGDFALTAGTVLDIVVGQKGSTDGGGGGSFVWVENASMPLLAAGGGGGAGGSSGTGYYGSGHDGVTGTSGTNGNGSGLGGANGGAGTPGNTYGSNGLNGSGGGGAGWNEDATGGYVGTQYDALRHGRGGSGGGGGEAGFGGGGSAWVGGGGGGGYSGGGGGTWSSGTGGGGGGSYNAGTNQANASGVQTGDGQVVVTLL